MATTKFIRTANATLVIPILALVFCCSINKGGEIMANGWGGKRAGAGRRPAAADGTFDIKKAGSVKSSSLF